MLECGPACSCGFQCPFGESQRGLSVGVALQTSDKVQIYFWNRIWHCIFMYFYQQEGPVYMYTQGMSVIASQNIDQGQFVAQYAGEMLTNGEADRRLAEYDASQAGVGHALLVLHAAGMPAHMHQLALLSLKTSFRITWVCILQLFN